MRKIFLLLGVVFGMVYTGAAQAPASAPASNAQKPGPTSLAEVLKDKSTRFGMCQVVFDASGHVKTAVMTKSLGSKVLDENTVSYGRKNWTGKPNTKVNIPITYEIPPSAKPSKGIPQVHVPRPPYPLQARVSKAQGSGVVKVTFDKTGRASSVVMKQSTGNSILDGNTINFALKNWRRLDGKTDTIYVPVSYKLR